MFERQADHYLHRSLFFLSSPAERDSKQGPICNDLCKLPVDTSQYIRVNPEKPTMTAFENESAKDASEVTIEQIFSYRAKKIGRRYL